jgi:hypothetical protein
VAGPNYPNGGPRPEFAEAPFPSRVRSLRLRTEGYLEGPRRPIPESLEWVGHSDVGDPRGAVAAAEFPSDAGRSDGANR